MRYSSYINNTKTSEWGLNLSQAYLFSLLADVGQWAAETIIDGKVYYWVSRNKIIEELPALTDKPDTVYRLLKQLSDAGLIDYTKQGAKDLVKLTSKGKEWNTVETRKNIRGSEKYPNELGKKSENYSEKNPTYNTTIKDNKTKDNKKEGIFSLCEFEQGFFLEKKEVYDKLLEWNESVKDKYGRPLSAVNMKKAFEALARHAKDDYQLALDMIEYNKEVTYQKLYPPPKEKVKELSIKGWRSDK